MQTQRISYKRHRFPPQIIAHVVWFYGDGSRALAMSGILTKSL
jgi:hypothetical protein